MPTVSCWSPPKLAPGTICGQRADLSYPGGAAAFRASARSTATGRARSQGRIETYADQAAFDSLMAAAGVLGLTGQPGRAAEVIVVGLPRTAALGRDGFSAVLESELAGQGIMPMDPSAYRRLDRVSTIIVDSAVLCAGQPLVLSASATNADVDDAMVWQAASGALRDRCVDDLSLASRCRWARIRHQSSRPRRNGPGNPGRRDRPRGRRGSRMGISP